MGPLGSTGYMHKKKTETTIDPGFNLTSGTSTEQTHESSTIGVIASQYTNSTTNTYADPYPGTGIPEVVTTKPPRLHATLGGFTHDYLSRDLHKHPARVIKWVRTSLLGCEMTLPKRRHRPINHLYARGVNSKCNTPSRRMSPSR